MLAVWSMADSHLLLVAARRQAFVLAHCLEARGRQVQQGHGESRQAGLGRDTHTQHVAGVRMWLSGCLAGITMQDQSWQLIPCVAATLPQHPSMDRLLLRLLLARHLSQLVARQNAAQCLPNNKTRKLHRCCCCSMCSPPGTPPEGGPIGMGRGGPPKLPGGLGPPPDGGPPIMPPGGGGGPDMDPCKHFNATPQLLQTTLSSWYTTANSYAVQPWHTAHSQGQASSCLLREASMVWE